MCVCVCVCVCWCTHWQPCKLPPKPFPRRWQQILSHIRLFHGDQKMRKPSQDRWDPAPNQPRIGEHRLSVAPLSGICLLPMEVGGSSLIVQGSSHPSPRLLLLTQRWPGLSSACGKTREGISYYPQPSWCRPCKGPLLFSWPWIPLSEGSGSPGSTSAQGVYNVSTSLGALPALCPHTHRPSRRQHIT